MNFNNDLAIFAWFDEQGRLMMVLKCKEHMANAIEVELYGTDPNPSLGLVCKENRCHLGGDWNTRAEMDADYAELEQEVRKSYLLKPSKNS